MKTNCTSPAAISMFLQHSKKLSSLVLKRFRMAFLLMAICLPGIAFTQGLGSTASGFEVDANFFSDTIPSFWKFTNPNQTYVGGKLFGDDWSKGTGAHNAVLKQVGGVSVPGITADRSALWQVDGNWGTDVPAETSVFGGTSNKNGDPIGLGQSPYTISSGSGGPQKNDITNVYLHTRRHPVTNDLWLFFGAETRSVNGSSYLDFEYNQAGVRTDSGNLMIGLGDVNGRTVEDLLLIVSYTKGGSVPLVAIRKWEAGGEWSNKLSLPVNTTFITTNTVDIAAVAPGKAFAGDGTASNTTSAFQFVEGGINISTLGLDGAQQCTPDATVTIKSRSSSSYTSELKDWSVLKFPLTPSSSASVADITPQCRSLDGVNVFSVSGTYEGGTPTWSTSAGTLSNQSYVDGVATADLTLNAPTASATVTLTTTSPNPYCPAGTANKTAVINENPAVVAAASPAGNVNIGTLPPHYELSTTVNGNLNSAGYSYAWVQNPAEAGNTGALSSYTSADPTFSAYVAQDFEWIVTATDDATGCYASDTVNRTIDPVTGCPTVIASPICADSTDTYSADVAPASYETWVWSVDNGATIVTPPANGGQSVKVQAGSSDYTLTLTKTFDNGTLAAVVCTTQVTVKPNPVGSANPETICSGETTSIALNSDLASTTFVWTAAIETSPAGGTISGFSDCSSSCGTSIGQTTLTNTGTTTGVVRYTVTPSKDGCSGQPFTVDATVNPVPVADQPGNQVVCDGESTTEINFTGSGATGFAWTNDQSSIGLASTGSGDILSFTATNSGASPVIATIMVTPQYDGGGVTCYGTAKSFTIIVNPKPQVNQPSSQTICQGTSTNAISFSGAGATSFDWTNTNPSIGLAASGTGDIGSFIGINTGSISEEAIIEVTPVYTGDGVTCYGPSKTFTITVNPKDPAPSTTYIPPTCTETTFSVQVDNPQVGSIYYLTQNDGNMVNIGPYASGDLIFTGLHIGEGYSVYSVTSEGCTSLTDDCGTAAAPTSPATTKSDPTTSASQVIMLNETPAKKPGVIASPNPFSDKIRFFIKVPETGVGSLELFNLVGQKVQTVFQGSLQKGSVKAIEYNVPYTQRSNLIYVFRMGDQKISGTLIGMKR